MCFCSKITSRLQYSMYMYVLCFMSPCSMSCLHTKSWHQPSPSLVLFKHLGFSLTHFTPAMCRNEQSLVSHRTMWELWPLQCGFWCVLHISKRCALVRSKQMKVALSFLFETIYCWSPFFLLVVFSSCVACAVLLPGYQPRRPKVPSKQPLNPRIKSQGARSEPEGPRAGAAMKIWWLLGNHQHFGGWIVNYRRYGMSMI